jgi:hypothetical protein
VCSRPPKCDRARPRFPPGLIDHRLAWIEPDHPRIEFGGQHLGKALGATAKIHDQGNSGSIDMG